MDLSAGPLTTFDFLEPEPGPEPPQDFIANGFMSEEMASKFVADFMTTPEQFPFVLLKPYMTLEYLRRERPCLLLAICVKSADMPLLRRLALEFRKMIAQALIVEAQKSLDLLQGLLIFCAWFALPLPATLQGGNGI